VSIDIANESGVEVDEAALAALARHVLDGMRVHPLAELSVLLVDEPAMAELHLHWMGEPGPTDVLAFPMDEIRPPAPGGTHNDHAGGEPEENPALLGDVVICPQVALVQAREAGHDAGAEISLLCTHGILHLLGFDHAEPDEHAAMFAQQDKLLGSWTASGGAVRADFGPAAADDGADGGAATDHGAHDHGAHDHGDIDHRDIDHGNGAAGEAADRQEGPR
jgi:probable rRNA maturation factor